MHADILLQQLLAVVPATPLAAVWLLRSLIRSIKAGFVVVLPVTAAALLCKTCETTSGQLGRASLLKNPGAVVSSYTKAPGIRLQTTSLVCDAAARSPHLSIRRFDGECTCGRAARDDRIPTNVQGDFPLGLLFTFLFYNIFLDYVTGSKKK